MDRPCLVDKNEHVSRLLRHHWVVELHILTILDLPIDIILVFWDVSGWQRLDRYSGLGLLFVLEHGEIFSPL